MADKKKDAENSVSYSTYSASDVSILFTSRNYYVCVLEFFFIYVFFFQIRLMQETCERILEYETSRHGMHRRIKFLIKG